MFPLGVSMTMEKKGETAVIKQHQSGEKHRFVIKTCRVFKTKRVSETKRQSDGLTGRFLAESKKTISSADDSPSLALARSALILINACDWKQNITAFTRIRSEASPQGRGRFLPDPASQAWPAALTTPVWGGASLVKHLPMKTTKTKL